MLVEVRVQSLGIDPASQLPVVILQESQGSRVVEIWIGPAEATAIAMHLADLEFARPLTHDLLVSVLGGLGGSLQKVVITKVEESTYFAELIIRRNGEVISVDARPSDSIAVALRLGAEIYADEELLERSSLQISEEEVVIKTGGEEDGPTGIMEPEELKEYLRKMNPEDFGRFTP